MCNCDSNQPGESLIKKKIKRFGFGGGGENITRGEVLGSLQPGMDQRDVSIRAALVAAVASRLWTHPLDTLRINRAISAAPPRSLYAGLPVALAFSVPGTTLFLLAYHWTSREVRRRLEQRSAIGVEAIAIAPHLVGATVAEAAAGLFFVPMEVIKQRQQLQLAGYSRGIAQAIASTPRRDLLRGYFPSLGAFVPFSGNMFLRSFESSNFCYSFVVLGFSILSRFELLFRFYVIVSFQSRLTLLLSHLLHKLCSFGVLRRPSF